MESGRINAEQLRSDEYAVMLSTKGGKFTDATYRSLVQLTAWLCAKYDLTADQVIRHYDVTGKICPKYFVEDEDAWVEFRRNVQDALEKQ